MSYNDATNRVLAGGGDQSKSITCCEEFHYTSFEFESIIHTKKIAVPGFDASWWLEIRPGGGNRRFPSPLTNAQQLAMPPEISFKAEFRDQSFYGSNLFTVSAEIIEYRSALPHMKFEFVKDSKIRMKDVSLTGASKSFTFYNYDFQENNSSAAVEGYFLSLYLECAVTFQFVGQFAETFDDAVKKLKNLASKPFGYLLEDDLFSDFTIFVGEKTFKVHKCILANSSDVLKTMLTCGLDETKSNTLIIDSEPEIFESLLKFIYEGRIPSDELASDSCCDLYQLADRFNMPILMEICKKYVEQLKVNSQNALKIYEFASINQISELLDTSWEIIRVELLDLKEACQPKPVQKVKEFIVQKAAALAKFEQWEKSLIEQKAAALAKLKQLEKSFVEEN